MIRQSSRGLLCVYEKRIRYDQVAKKQATFTRKGIDALLPLASSQTTVHHLPVDGLPWLVLLPFTFEDYYPDFSVVFSHGKETRQHRKLW